MRAEQGPAARLVEGLTWHPNRHASITPGPVGIPTQPVFVELCVNLSAMKLKRFTNIASSHESFHTLMECLS